MSDANHIEAIARLLNALGLGHRADELERVIAEAAYWINAENTPLEFAVSPL